jgi:hypothetical protein
MSRVLQMVEVRSAPGAGRAPRGRADVRPVARRRLAAPDPRDVLAARFATLFCEVEAGQRPRRHLRPLMSPLLYAKLADVWVRGGEPGVVIAVRGHALSSTVYEAVVVVRRGAHCGAIALRLTQHESAWRVDEVARPEDGPLPMPAGALFDHLDEE